MKKKEIITIIVVLIAIVVIAIVLVKNFNNRTENQLQETESVNVENEERVEVLADGTRLNISEKLLEPKTFEGMKITDLQLTERENVTLLLGTVTNISKTMQGGYPVNITVIDKEGEKIITIAAFLGELQPGESTQLSTSATFDYVDAYDFVISKK